MSHQPTPPSDQQQAAIAEANRRIQAILQEFDLQIAFHQQYLNGEQTAAGFILIPNPPRVLVPGAVKQAIKEMNQ